MSLSKVGKKTKGDRKMITCFKKNESELISSRGNENRPLSLICKQRAWMSCTQRLFSNLCYFPGPQEHSEFATAAVGNAFLFFYYLIY